MKEGITNESAVTKRKMEEKKKAAAKVKWQQICWDETSESNNNNKKQQQKEAETVAKESFWYRVCTVQSDFNNLIKKAEYIINNHNNTKGTIAPAPRETRRVTSTKLCKLSVN